MFLKNYITLNVLVMINTYLCNELPEHYKDIKTQIFYCLLNMQKKIKHGDDRL